MPPDGPDPYSWDGPEATEWAILRPWFTGCGLLLMVAAIWIVLLTLRPWSIPLYQDDARTLAAVQRAIPRGTSLSNARKVLVRSGFECEVHDDVPETEFVEERVLFCWETRYINRWEFGFFGREWRVVLALDGDTVAGASVASGITAF